MTRVLAVENEAPIRQLLKVTLASASFDVRAVASAEEALNAINVDIPHVMLIDWMLPGVSGPQLIRLLRDDVRTATLPLIMLTTRDEEADCIADLGTGPDDYITKPFKPSELVSRIRTLLKYRTPQHGGGVIEAAGVVLDPADVTVSVDGAELQLNPPEFKLLRLLMSQPRRVFTRNQIVNLIWGDSRSIEERTVDVSVRRLRVAMGCRGAELIEAVRGVGYRFSGKVA
ncbi:MAG: winged helix-turn-helix domain-containing protein [Sterolibacterium sp.]